MHLRNCAHRLVSSRPGCFLAALGLVLAARLPAAVGPGVVQPTFTAAEVGTVIANFDEAALGKQPTIVDFQHGWLYVGTGGFGTNGTPNHHWFNFSNPRVPVLDGSQAAFGNKPHAISFWGNNFIDGGQSSTLRTYDFVNRTLLGQFATTVSPVAYGPQPPYEFRGTNGYITDPNTLAISNFSNPAAPTLVATKDLGALLGFNIGGTHPIGNLLIVSASQSKGMAVLDISNPANPVVLGTKLTGNPVYLSMVYGSRLYNCETNVGIRVYDFANPAAIVEEGLVSTGGNPRYVALKEGKGYCFPGNSQLKVFDAVTRAILNTFAVSGSSDFAFPLGNMLISGGSGSANQLRVIPLQQSPDTQGPAVAFVNPANGATNVALTGRVGFSMTDHIDVTSLNTTNLIVRPVGGSAIAGTYSVNHYGVVNFSPAAPLLSGTTYEVILPLGGVRDIVGNGLRTAFSSTFTTANTGTNTPPTITAFTTSDNIVPTSTAITFATTATDPNAGQTLQYAFDFGDGTSRAFTTASTASKTYTAAGRYTVIAKVTDGTATVTTSLIQIVHKPVTTPQPTHSGSIAYDASRDKLWNVNPDHGSVTRIAAGAMTRDAIHPVGAEPRYLALRPDNSEIWVSCAKSGEIHILNAATGAAVTTINLGPDSRPAGLAFAPNGSAVFVALEGLGILRKIDPATRGVVASLTLDSGIRAVAVGAGSGRVLVTQFITPFVGATADSGEIYDINPATMALTRTMTLPFDTTADSEISGRGAPNYLTDVAFSPDGGRAWVAAKKDNTARGQRRDGLALTHDNTVRTILSQLDLAANAEVLADRIDVNDQGFAHALAYSPAGDLAFGAFILNNEILAFDTASGNRLAGAVVGSAPDGLVTRPDGTRLYVHNFLGRSVSALNITAVVNGTGSAITTAATVATTTTEPLTAQVLLGKKIFYNASDPRMSLEGYMSCAACHLGGDHDGRVWDFSDRGEGFRNTHDLRGKAGMNHGPVHWSGNFDEIQDFELDIRGGFIGGEVTGFGGSGFITSGTPNPSLGAPNAGRSADLDALAAYVASLSASVNSPYRNPDGTLTASAVAGRTHFINLDCQACHQGNRFTESRLNLFRNIGTLKTTSGNRLGGPLTGIDTPTLRGAWNTAPYLHDGSAIDLVDVFSTANAPAGTAHAAFRTLTAGQQTQLLDFLLQLDDREPAALGPVPATGLTHHWKFDGNATDSVGTNNGTVTGATFVTGYYAQGASFDGADNIDVGTVAFGNAFTISMRVWVNGTASNIQTLLANSVSGNAANGFRIFVNASGTSDRSVRFETGNGTAGNTAATAAAALEPNAWNHVLITVDRTAGTAALWINGVNATVDGTIRTDFATSANTDFGQMTGGNFRLNGRLDQVRTYNRILTAAEIGQLFRE